MKAVPRRLLVAARPAGCSDDPRVTAHQVFIRSLPCVACGKRPPSEAAHFGMPAGLGPSLAAQCLVPLCGPASLWDDCCHSRKYFLGSARFWSAHGIDPRRLALRLWQISGDVATGEREIRRARTSPQTKEPPINPGTFVRAARSGRAASFGTLPAAIGPNHPGREGMFWSERR